MAGKRSGEAGERSGEPAAKRACGPRDEEFNGARFKALLRDPAAAAKGLETFVAIAKTLPSPQVYDVVEGYVKISMECAEIFRLLDGERKPESEMLLIFQALEAILLRTASDLSHFSVVGMNIVKKLIHSYMKLVYAALYSENHRVSRGCLALLAAMVAQGPDSARDVYSHFDFNNKYLPGLLKRRCKQGRPDVRMAYIQFALSFLIAGDNAILAQVLELKDFIPAILRSEIKEDRVSTVNLLLSTLTAKVVHNKNISKTQKVRFFTAEVLLHISSLYRWNGITDVSPEDFKVPQGSEEVGKAVVRELVHSFLMDLCCSLKHGITFHDPSLGTCGKGGNVVLLHFLLGLKTATEDEMVADLVVNILKVCPDLLNRYFKESQYSFVPRVKSAWMDNMRLLRKIYEAQPEISSALKSSEFIPLPRLLSMVMVTTVPAVCSRTMLTQGLNLPSTEVKQSILSLVSMVLRRALRNIEHCLSEEAWQGSQVCTLPAGQEFVQLYREALSKVLPDMTSIVAVWQSLLKQERGHSSGPAEKKEGDVSTVKAMTETEDAEHHASDDAETLLLKAALLQVICLYQKVVPHMVAQSNFDFSKLIKGIVTERGLREEVPPLLQHHILKVALELPANKFAWFKVQDMSETEKVSGEKSVFYLLMKMFVTSTHSHLKFSTKQLIIKVLRDSGVFEYTWKELSLWLEHLDNTKEDQKEAVIQFLERVLLKLVAKPYPYTDRAADVVQEASLLQLSVLKQDSDSISIPVSHIDDVLDMVDVLIEGTDDFDEEIGFSLNEDMIIQTFPFSAVVPAALEARNILLLQSGDGTGAHIVEYLVAVFTDLLHSQREPLALCLMFQLYDKDLKSLEVSKYPQLCQFNQYYKLWIPKQSQEPVFKDHKGVSEEPAVALDSVFATLLRSAYERGSSALLEEAVQSKLRDLAARLPPEQLLLGVKHLLLYLKSTVESFSRVGRTVGPQLLGLFVDLLSLLLCRGSQMKLEQQQRQEQQQPESDLFMDEQSLMAEVSSNDKTLEDALTLIFGHPTLQSWFLAVELRSVPQPGLNPVTVKLLSAQLSSGVLQLLKTAAPMVQGLPAELRHGLSRYLEAVTRGVLAELQAVGQGTGQGCARRSQQLQALEELHTYMDAAQLKEITLTMLQLPETSLTEQKSEQSPKQGKQLNVYGQVLVKLLTDSYQRHPQQGEFLLSPGHMKALGMLMSASASPDLEQVFLQALQSEPGLALAVGVEVQAQCLARGSHTSLAIVALLIQHCRTHLLHFELWCLGTGTGRYLRRHLESFLPLIDVYLQCREQHAFSRPSTVISAVTPVLRKALWKELCASIQDPGAAHEASLKLQILAKLVPPPGSKGLQSLMGWLPAALERAGGEDSWAVADAICTVLTAPEELHSWRTQLLAACIKGLVAIYSSRTDGSKPEVERSMLLRLEELLAVVGAVDPGDWSSLVKTGLRHRYRDGRFLKVLNAAMQALYREECPTRQGLLQLSRLHMMVTQHSLFLPAFLRHRDEDGSSAQTREALVDILLTAVQLSPSLCDSSHLPVLLGAYGATLSTTDQKILLLLQLYEKNNQSLINSRILLWGPAAVEHHKTCKSLGKSLWQQPSMEEILCLLDREKMMRTILSFPQQRRLLPAQGIQESLYKDETVKSLDDFYDPCFLLQLFSELTRPECVVACHKFVEVNALGLTVAALSSYDPSMRAAAYSVLASFRCHLHGARCREQSQLLYLLDAVQNGIRQPNLRLTFSLSLYIARAAQQILRPEEHMYIKVNRFLLSHQYLDLRKVPGFFQLFYSFDFEYKTEREWILRFLGEGLRDKHCYELYDYQSIFQVILSFSNSPLCDEASQRRILEILQSAARVPRAAYELVQDHSLLTWLLHSLQKRFLENKVIHKIISLVHTLWLTNSGDKRQTKNPSQEKRKLLPIQLVNEFLCVLVALIKHIRAGTELARLAELLSTLSSVLQYRAGLLEAFRDLGRVAVNAGVLSCTELLLLLHRWSLVSTDLQLQHDLQALAHKYQHKELLKDIQDKNKAQASCPVYRHPRQSSEVGGGDAAADEGVPELEECGEHLNAILAHWDPGLPAAPCPQGGATLRAGGEAGAVTCASIHVVTKLLLRSLAGQSPLGEQAVSPVLRWLRSRVLPRAGAVQELLGDGALRSGLWRLHTRLCQASGSPGGLCRQLGELSSIMLQLMEQQGRPSPFHGLLTSLCPSAAPEQDAHEAAVSVFLASLSIGDTWLGAQQPDLLLTHARLVCTGADCELQGDLDTRKQGEQTLLSLCKKIWLHQGNNSGD